MTKIEILKSMLTSDQRNAPVWLLLGLEHAEQGDRTEALQAFTQALAYGNESMKEKIVIELNKLQKESPYSRTLKGINQKDSSTYTTMFSPKIRVIEGGKGKTTAKSVQLVEKTAGFGMVGGLVRVKEAIFQRLLHPISQRLPQKKSTILLYGPSGCGKSLLAKATAEECQAHFFSMAITGGRSMYTPSNRQFNIHDLLATTPANKPFLFFLDELDASSHYEEHANSSNRQGFDSKWLQQIAEAGEYDERFVLMGATNVPWELEPSMLRAAGFDHWIFVGPPDRQAREDIFRLKLEGRPTEMLDYGQLAGWTEFYSGADIEYVVELATEQVWHDIVTKGVDRPIQMSDLREAIAATYPTTIEWLRTLKEHLKQVDYHGIYDEVWDYLSLHTRI
ncbi:ATP-binding protein [Brevibacillus brevis]|uniref:ATP-binding protein n=1 Tax=Brevibacillus brevis TaxID=1393 RepID=A0A2Z4MKR0_BREBE|nr:AAA family ATPase [Brevibacillus brevis]AWX57092.1 ATP-binding protein [Brevibacillus brevis]